ncbi:hypothetical protein V3W47_14510 [Deinococcus sp. YIM 134068]|uniref:hypothetical protein n=1 Tax=Deinococcus lichenicola TaxID=3118910 RepID=UPI002F952CCA
MALIGFLYVAALVPTTSTLYEPDMPVMRAFGVGLPPNLLAGTLALAALPFAYRLARRALTPPAPPPRTTVSRGPGG